MIDWQFALEIMQPGTKSGTSMVGKEAHCT